MIMASIEDNLISNAKLLIALLTNGSTEVKAANIIKCLNEGANVNESFTNYFNNTPLHIAVGKEDKNVVELLLEHGADITLQNNEGKTAMDVAKDLNTVTGEIIIEIIQAHDKKLQQRYKVIKFARYKVSEKNLGANKLSLFQKLPDTIGIKGDSYETKLLSLILIRTLLNKDIEHFCIGTKIQSTGALDDICLRYTENNKDAVVYLQAKHNINDKVTLKDLWNSTGNYSLYKYLKTYLNIRQMFDTTTNDGLFHGRYEDMKHHFIIYTTAQDEMSSKKILNQYSVDKTLRDIFNTRENCHIFQYKYDDKDIELLTKVILRDRMNRIGEKLYACTHGNKYKNILYDRLFRSYHVLLAKTVINVSATAVDGVRIGYFREEFLASDNELMSVLKDAFFNEAVTKTSISDETLLKIVEMALLQPSVKNISKFLQTVPTSYDIANNRLNILNDNIKELVSTSLYEPIISHSTYNEAFQIAVKEKLSSYDFKLPLSFGNVDFVVNDKADGGNTLNTIALKLENVISEFNDGNVVINNSNGLVRIDPSLIGNVFVFDEDSRLFKFNTQVESLGRNAKNILSELEIKLKDLDTYKFQFNTDSIPKMSFEADEYDNSLARDFFNNLWFYTRQAEEHEIDVYAKYNLADHNYIKQKPNNTFSVVQSDAIFIKIHNEIHKWWLSDTTKGHYLTNYMQIFDEILNDLTSNTLLSILNYIYVNEIKAFGIYFNEQAILSLGLDTLTGLTIIETANISLTAIKLYHYFNLINDSYAFIDFNYVSGLTLRDKEILLKELETNDRDTIIIIYEQISNGVDNLNDFLNPSLGKRIILVIDENDLERVMKKALVREHIKEVRDDKFNLYDLTSFSQSIVLQKKLIYQGIEVSFETLIDAESEHLVTGSVLNAIINNKTIEIGKTLSTPSYEEIKDYYVQRCLYRSKVSKTPLNKNDQYSPLIQEGARQIKTLEEIENSVVLIAASGMGKSTLLTHLSIETKKNNPRLWIERINLFEHVTDFCKWQEDNVKVDHLEAVRFLCKSVISKHLNGQDLQKINFDIEVANGVFSLKDSNELEHLVLFELEIFINCYNRGNTILIFDGFDELRPQYKNYVLELLKFLAFKTVRKSGDKPTDNLEVKQRMWITSRPHSPYKKTLRTQCDSSYILKPFTDMEQSCFVEKYLRRNLNLKDLSYREFQNIDSLFEYVIQFSELYKDINEAMLRKTDIAPLQNLYCALIPYFQNEIRHTPTSSDKAILKEKWNSDICCLKASELSATWNNVSERVICYARTPLHIFIALNYFETRIKSLKDVNLPNRWDLSANTFEFCESFLEVKVNRRLDENNGMVLRNSDSKITYERERFEFLTEMKRLAFYSIFKNEAKRILDGSEINEVKQTIKRIYNGEEKAGLVENVGNGVPEFVHFSLAEHLAAECITDLLRTGSYEKQAKTLEFVLDVFIPSCSIRILKYFNRKLNCKSIYVISNKDLKGFVVDYLFNKHPYSLDIQTLVCNFFTNSLPFVVYVKSTLDVAVYCGMKDFVVTLLTAVTDEVNEHNLDEFIVFIQKHYFFTLSIVYGFDEILEIVLNCVRRVDNNKLSRIFMIANRSGSKLPALDSSIEEIINYFKTVLPNTAELIVRRKY